MLLHCGGKYLQSEEKMKTITYENLSLFDSKMPGIEVRKEDELYEHEISLINQAELNGLAEIEAWTALGTNNQINYSTHGLFRYFGKFPSTIGTHLIMEYSKENENVMDPMSGSGTTAVECLLNRRNCRSYDINPLSVLLAKVKTTHIVKDKLDAELLKIETNYKPLTKEKYCWEPVGLKNISHWFLEETQDSIRGLIYLIDQIEDTNVKNFYNICLSSCIRTVSRATTQQGRLFLDVETAKTDCLETFVKKAKKAIDAVSNLPKKETNLEIDLHDATMPFENNDNNLIICHPPYFNSYKYSSINSLELSWMKINHADVRKKEIREFFKVGKAEKVTYYIDDMLNLMNNISKSLEVNGTLALMIGDTVIKGEYIPVTRMLIDKYLELNKNIAIEKVVLRVPKYTEASWTASQRRKSGNVGITLNDFIIIFRRKM